MWIRGVGCEGRGRCQKHRCRHNVFETKATQLCIHPHKAIPRHTALLARSVSPPLIPNHILSNVDLANGVAPIAHSNGIDAPPQRPLYPFGLDPAARRPAVHLLQLSGSKLTARSGAGAPPTVTTLDVDSYFAAVIARNQQKNGRIEGLSGWRWWRWKFGGGRGWGPRRSTRVQVGLKCDCLQSCRIDSKVTRLTTCSTRSCTRKGVHVVRLPTDKAYI